MVWLGPTRMVSWSHAPWAMMSRNSEVLPLPYGAHQSDAFTAADIEV